MLLMVAVQVLMVLLAFQAAYPDEVRLERIQ